MIVDTSQNRIVHPTLQVSHTFHIPTGTPAGRCIRARARMRPCRYRRRNPIVSRRLTVSELLVQRLDRIETLLEQLVSQRTVKDWYSIAEVAQILGRAEFTVREWCRFRRVYASKRACGRNHAKELVISHEKLTRIQNESLLAT